jgi:DNA gyrase subunit B
VLAAHVIERLANWMDVEALRAMANGLALDLDTPPPPKPAPPALQAALHDAEVSRRVRRAHRQAPAAHQPPPPRQHQVQRHHAGLRARRRLRGADRAGLSFKGLLGADAIVRRGEGEKAKEQKVGDFRAAMAWLMQQAENSVGRQRYKGLGEMNPEQLWETTMDPTVRRLLRVQIDDAIEADRVFTMLMGDEVEPRRDFIESNALRAANIDV